MQLAPARPRRQVREAIVPMINVVFLLLIFFVMTATLTPPAPFEVLPPTATDTGTQPDPETPLFVAADGAMAYGTARGAFVFKALAGRSSRRPLTLRADAQLEGAVLAQLLVQLARAGITSVELVTVVP